MKADMEPEPRIGVCVFPSARVTWCGVLCHGVNVVNSDLFVINE